MKGNRGTVLIHVIVTVALVTSIVFALLMRAASDQASIIFRRSQADSLLIEDAARAALQASFADAVRSGNFSSINSQSSAALGNLSNASWDRIDFTGDWTSSQLFSKGITPSGGAFRSPINGTTKFGPRVESRVNGSISLTAHNETGDVVRSSAILLDVVEVPSVDFQLIASTGPYDAGSSTTAVYLDGKALFNAGLKRSFAQSLTASASSVIYSQPSSGESFSGLTIPSAPLPVASWGFPDVGMLVADPNEVAATDKTPAFLSQNYPTYVSTQADGVVLDWIDPNTPPAGMPFGITLQSFNGQTHLIVNLGTWVASRGLFVRCSNATKDLGVAVVGSSSGFTAAAVITTNGRITLVGANSRPVVIASSHAAGPVVLSSAFVGTAGTAASTSWRGYLLFPVSNLNFEAPENWSAATYTIQGTLFYKGGSIKGIPTLQILSDPIARAAIESQFTNSDRMVMAFPRLSAP